MIQTIVILVIAAGWWLTRDGGGFDEPQVSPGLPDIDAYAAHFDRSWPELEAGASVAVANRLTAANYYLVLDGSGSMEDQRCSGSQSKMDAAKDAVAQFAQQIPGDANLGLAVFDGSGLSERLGLQAVNQTAFRQEVQRVTANGGTPLMSAVNLGYAALKQQARSQLGYGEYHLVLITDGEASGGEDPTSAVRNILEGSPVLIHTIGFCIGTDHSLNQPGRIDYRAADDPEALAQSLTAVLAESPDFTVTEF
ncbi:MAG: vWA domain-containing protein [Pseudomonadota bacterium]